jgi:DNA-binding MarR family transcriptional regulator
MSDEKRRAWELFHVANERVRREVGRDLWADAQLSDAEFTVLAHLAMGERGGEPVRPSECARAIGWDSSRLAHQLRRLEGRGLIERAPGEGDGRSSVIAFTDEGRAAYRSALGPHLRSATAWFGDALSDDQAAALVDALDAVMAHIERRASETGAGEARSGRVGADEGARS